MLLSEGEDANDHQTHQDQPGYDIFNHVYHCSYPSVMFCTASGASTAD
jgi:hypothetical protein